MKKNLLICPTCRNNGVKSILGELTKDNTFLIQRFHKGYTEIIGKDFGVKCGACGEPVFIRKDHERNSNQWKQRVSWTQIVGTIGTI